MEPPTETAWQLASGPSLLPLPLRGQDNRLPAYVLTGSHPPQFRAMNRIPRSLTLLLVVAYLGADKPLIDDYVKASVGPIPSDLTLDAFYKKHADALGIPVVSSEKVPDARSARGPGHRHPHARQAARPRVRRWSAAKLRVVVMAPSESTTDLPEQRDWKKPGPHDRRLTSASASTTSKASADDGQGVLGPRGTAAWAATRPPAPKRTCWATPAPATSAKTFSSTSSPTRSWTSACGGPTPSSSAEIGDAYKAAMDKGLWKGHYAATNANEYWAEGTQTWFWSNYEYKDGETTVMTPDDLKGYDPTLYDLLSQVYADHHIPLDVYHAKGLRRTAAGHLLRNPVRAMLLGRTSDGGQAFHVARLKKSQVGARLLRVAPSRRSQT